VIGVARPLRYRIDLTSEENGLFLEIYYDGYLIFYEKVPVVDKNGRVVGFTARNTIIVPENVLDEFFEKLERIREERT